MKKLKSIILLLALSTGLFVSSCGDWLDVLSNEEILEEDAFATTRGYRTALVGAYQVAASSNFYGKELTWGLMSALGRNYLTSSLTSAYKNAIDTKGFENSYTKTVIDNIWKTGYNVIANCNNLLQNVEKSNQNFEYEWEQDMIIAEAKALRALIHFDLLRLFAKAPIVGNTAKAIPYVTTYPNIAPEYKSTSEIIDLIIADLKDAREKLKVVDVDVLWMESMFANNYFSTMLFYGIQNLMDDGTRGNGTAAGFFCFRGYRMNYWAVTGLLARVYSYKGDNASAVPYVDELLFYSREGYCYDFAWDQAPNNNPNLIDGKRCPESLISFWNTKVAETYEGTAGTSYFKMNTLTSLFGADINEDYRYTALYNTSTKQYRVWDDVDNNYTKDSYIEQVRVGCPVLEIPEMYYIKAEYYAEKNMLDSAAILLNEVRYARNLTSELPAVSSKEEFIDLLVNDMTRDFLTRGQLWFYLKKLNYKKMYEGNPVWWDVPENWYVLPIPESETMY